MTALNTEIDHLDNLIPGEMQLDLYRAVQDLLLDRLVWFLRNVDLAKGLAGVVQHYRTGIAAVEAALSAGLGDVTQAYAARCVELSQAGVPEPLARRLAYLPILAAAPDIVLVAERTGRSIADVTTTHFAAQSYFRLDRIARAARGIAVADYFDRLALDRSLDSIGEAERRLTSLVLQAGAAGAPAVETWARTRADEVERTRAAIHAIAGSGLTLSKLSVAASMLGDLAKQ
jgi:glutamate dehydrogenase